ncbi:MaoC family dehydratase [Roseovarius faecimaris]|uniref:MaoC family dehydratase n=1 Tax=Roseovarius faecimaris TaxID=2494550 RepID=A0A6I6IKD0_9RHOB|nr:MaoC family dehydratase [Roseovarius faecimaris]QGX97460.1 MaoC family dehydratase [Roseovarius faecimaris]
MYLDDLSEGFTFVTDARAVSESDIIGFARQWDPQAFHVDKEAAEASPFGGLIASGFHTMLIAFVLTLEADIWNEASMGSPGMDELRWLAPVRPGDVLSARGTILSVTPSSSRPDRGRAVIKYEVLNQDDQVVMSYLITHILRRSGTV